AQESVALAGDLQRALDALARAIRRLAAAVAVGAVTIAVAIAVHLVPFTLSYGLLSHHTPRSGGRPRAVDSSTLGGSACRPRLPPRRRSRRAGGRARRCRGPDQAMLAGDVSWKWY